MYRGKVGRSLDSAPNLTFQAGVLNKSQVERSLVSTVK
jgi:hypothetical protein